MAISLSNRLGTDLIPVGFNYGLTRYASSSPTPTTLENILIVGGFSIVGGLNHYYNYSLSKYDGTVENLVYNDNANNPQGFNSGVFNVFYNSVTNRIYYTGVFVDFKGNSCNRFLVLNADGSNTGDFPYGSLLFDNYTHYVYVTDDGKMLIGGNFTSYEGISSNRIVRLNPDYTIDATFNVGTGFDNLVNCIDFDGTYFYVTGQFLSYKGVGCKGLAILNEFGDLIWSYAGFNGDWTFYCHLSVDKQSLYVGGNLFTQFNGIPTPSRMVKLDISGLPAIQPTPSLDPWNANVNAFGGFNNRVHDFSVKTINEIDEIVVGGNFSNVGGLGRDYIVKINPDGTLDAGFPSVNPSLFCRFAHYMNDETKVCFGGGFTNYDGSPQRDRFAVVNHNNGNTVSSFNSDYWSGTFQEPYNMIEIP